MNFILSDGKKHRTITTEELIEDSIYYDTYLTADSITCLEGRVKALSEITARLLEVVILHCGLPISQVSKVIKLQGSVKIEFGDKL